MNDAYSDVISLLALDCAALPGASGAFKVCAGAPLEQLLKDPSELYKNAGAHANADGAPEAARPKEAKDGRKIRKDKEPARALSAAKRSPAIGAPPPAAGSTSAASTASGTARPHSASICAPARQPAAAYIMQNPAPRRPRAAMSFPAAAQERRCGRAYGAPQAHHLQRVYYELQAGYAGYVRYAGQAGYEQQVLYAHYSHYAQEAQEAQNAQNAQKALPAAQEKQAEQWPPAEYGKQAEYGLEEQPEEQQKDQQREQQRKQQRELEKLEEMALEKQELAQVQAQQQSPQHYQSPQQPADWTCQQALENPQQQPLQSLQAQQILQMPYMPDFRQRRQPQRAPELSKAPDAAEPPAPPQPGGNSEMPTVRNRRGGATARCKRRSSVAVQVCQQGCAGGGRSEGEWLSWPVCQPQAVQMLQMAQLKQLAQVAWPVQAECGGYAECGSQGKCANYTGYPDQSGCADYSGCANQPVCASQAASAYQPGRAHQPTCAYQPNCVYQIAYGSQPEYCYQLEHSSQTEQLGKRWCPGGANEANSPVAGLKIGPRIDSRINSQIDSQICFQICPQTHSQASPQTNAQTHSQTDFQSHSQAAEQNYYSDAQAPLCVLKSRIGLAYCPPDAAQLAPGQSKPFEARIAIYSVVCPSQNAEGTPLGPAPSPPARAPTCCEESLGCRESALQAPPPAVSFDVFGSGAKAPSTVCTVRERHICRVVRRARVDAPAGGAMRLEMEEPVQKPAVTGDGDGDGIGVRIEAGVGVEIGAPVPVGAVPGPDDYQSALQYAYQGGAYKAERLAERPQSRQQNKQQKALEAAKYCSQMRIPACPLKPDGCDRSNMHSYCSHSSAAAARYADFQGIQPASGQYGLKTGFQADGSSAARLDQQLQFAPQTQYTALDNLTEIAAIAAMKALRDFPAQPYYPYYPDHAAAQNTNEKAEYSYYSDTSSQSEQSDAEKAEKPQQRLTQPAKHQPYKAWSPAMKKRLINAIAKHGANIARIQKLCFKNLTVRQVKNQYQYLRRSGLLDI